MKKTFEVEWDEISFGWTNGLIVEALENCFKHNPEVRIIATPPWEPDDEPLPIEIPKVSLEDFKRTVKAFVIGFQYYSTQFSVVKSVVLDKTRSLIHYLELLEELEGGKNVRKDDL